MPVIRIYTGNVIGPENTLSAAAGGTGDGALPGTATALAALLRVENDQSVKRASLYAALSARPSVLAAEDLDTLRQADDQASMNPSQPLAGINRLNATTWYRGMSVTIGDTRTVTGELTSQVPDRANTLKSSASRSLLIVSIAALALLLLLLTSAVLARPAAGRVRINPGRGTGRGRRR